MATNRLPSVLPTNSWEGWHEDEVVEELHLHRAEIAERFNCDMKRMYEYYVSVTADSQMALADIQPVVSKRADI